MEEDDHGRPPIRLSVHQQERYKLPPALHNRPTQRTMIPAIFPQLLLLVLLHSRPTNAHPPPSTLQCLDSPPLTTTAFWPHDCYTAIALFEDYDVYRHAGTVFEFYAADKPPLSPSRVARPTPRKYRYKSCAMVIAMWRDIPEGLIPMPMPDSGRPWPRTDLGDFKTMESKVLGIRDGCLGVVVGAGRRRWRLGHERWGRAGKEEEGGGGGGLGFVNPTGYDVAGVNGGIGVFLWATGSLMDGLVREEGETAGVVGSGNLTVGGGDDGRGNATRWGAGLATGDFV